MTSACVSGEEIDAFVAGSMPAAERHRVRRHAQSCATCDARISQYRRRAPRPDRLTAEVPASEPPTAGAAGERPRRLGHFELLDEVQRGVQGIVYRARDLRLDRLVALKVQAARDTPGGARQQRFEREIQVAALLDHANIAPIYEHGIDDGWRWFAMKLVEGEDLETMLLAGPLPEAQALAIALGLCDAMAHAHVRGVLHRDLKPSNIRLDTSGRPHVLDFGLATMTGPEQPVSSLTAEGVFVGTLSHAAPEQVAGSAAAVDTRTDIHALGVILYEMLTGALPRDLSGDFADVVARLRDSEPRTPLLEGKRLRRDIETILLRALATEKSRRYQTVDALATDIRRYRDGEAIEARRDNAWYVLGMALRRHRALVGAIALLGVVLVASIVIVARQRNLALAAEALARGEAQRATLEAATSNQVADFMVNLVQPPGGASPDPSKVRLLDALAAGRAGIDGLEASPELRARLQTALGSAYLRLGDVAAARELLGKAWAFQGSAGVRDVHAARTRTGLGRIAYADDDPAEAERHYRAAVEYTRDSLGTEHVRTAATMVNLAGHVKDLDERRDILLEAMRILDAAGPSQREAALYARQLLSGVHAERGDVPAAVEVLRECLAGYRGMGDASVRVAEIHCGLAERLGAMGRHAEALENARECLAIRQEVFGPIHPGLIEAGQNVGALTCEAGRPAEGLPLVEDAIRRIDATEHGDMAITADWRLGRARCARDLGDATATRRAYQDAIAWMEAHHPELPQLAVARAELAAVR